MELADGSLPWTNIRDPKDVEKSKLTVKPEGLCKNQPRAVLEFVNVSGDTRLLGTRTDDLACHHAAVRSDARLRAYHDGFPQMPAERRQRNVTL